MDVTIHVPKMEIIAIHGKWNRWTTPECPRAVKALQEAVGFRVEEEGFSQRIQKTIGRRACRHHANLLLECCYSAREAAHLARRGNAKTGRKDPNSDAFVKLEEPAKKHTAASQKGRVRVASNRQEKRGTRSTKEEPAGGLVIDLHVHTYPASACSVASVDEMIKEAVRIGLDGICLTDHNHIWEPDEAEELRQRYSFMVLRGNEVTTDQGDMLVFGLEQDIKGIITLENLRKKVLETGGFVIAAHPFRGFLTFDMGRLGLTPEKAMERSLFKWVDAVEVLNGKVTEKENTFAAKVAGGLGLPMTGGSDAHEVAEVGLYATRFAQRIKNQENLLEALRTGEFAPVAFRQEKEKFAAPGQRRNESF
jgi:predicted metal-dependent phosphoesterase TrpH